MVIKVARTWEGSIGSIDSIERGSDLACWEACSRKLGREGEPASRLTPCPLLSCASKSGTSQEEFGNLRTLEKNRRRRMSRVATEESNVVVQSRNKRKVGWSVVGSARHQMGDHQVPYSLLAGRHSQYIVLR